MIRFLNAVVLRWFDVQLERSYELREAVSLSVAAKYRYSRRYWIPRLSLISRGDPRWT